MNDRREYKTSFEDEVDWKIIEQLHSATSKFSSASIELKKMYLILVGITTPAIIKLSNDSLDFSLFITLYILTLTFWYLDSFTFFHQENLRDKMDIRFQKLKFRNTINEQSENNENEEYTLENNRTSADRWKRAFKDSSVRIYQVFIFLNTIGFVLYLTKII